MGIRFALKKGIRIIPSLAATAFEPVDSHITWTKSMEGSCHEKREHEQNGRPHVNSVRRSSHRFLLKTPNYFH